MPTLEIVEIVATITGVICVWFFIRQNIWAWPAAVVSAALFGLVFLDAALYSNMGLQGFYIVLACYGWYQWRRGGAQKTGVTVRHLTPREAVVLGGLTLTAAVVVTAALAYVTGYRPITGQHVVSFVAVEPAKSLDALATAMSLAGTWMQAKKVLQNWLLWIVTDIILAGVFLSQELYFTTGLYLLYLGMATMGYRAWRKELRS